MTGFNSIRSAVCAALGVLGVGVMTLAHAQGYTVVQVGGTGYQGNDLNNSGQVVGMFPGTDFSPPGGFLWNGGTTTFLTAPSGGQVGGANAINASGQVAGTSTFGATVWSGGSPTLLPPLGGSSSSQGFGINNSGQVVGFSSIGCCAAAATLWSGGTATNLGTLGGSSGLAFGINSSGQVVGMSTITGDTANRATLWSGGTIVNLGAERAVAINDAGQIVGQGSNAGGSGGATFWNSSASGPIDLGWGSGPGAIANDLNGAGDVVGMGAIGGSWGLGSEHGLLWDGSTSFDLNSLLDAATWSDWTILSAVAINDLGQILVRAATFQSGTDTLGSFSTLLLTPCSGCTLVTADLYLDRFRAVTGIPEPETYAMLLAGLGLLGWQARRRKLREAAAA
jgi:probable HAF family extracellular repeat protein